MSFLVMNKMWERVSIARQDSDTTLFYDLLFTGEMLCKIIVSGLVAAVADERERHRYRHIHRLVRADGLGDWAQVMEEILAGPTSQHLMTHARDEQREFTQKSGIGNWQYEAVQHLHAAIKLIDQNYEDLPVKVDARKWLHLFVAIRNRTRGHGALQSSLCSAACDDIEQSIKLVAENFILLQRPWVHLHRNLSGKYRITSLAGDVTPFSYLKSTNTVAIPDGVYVQFDSPARVELMATNEDAADFVFPNGNFTGKTYETISYITGSKSNADARPYLVPAGELPPSETQGIGLLDIHGKAFANIPPSPAGYVHRIELEKTLCALLEDDHHPIITLVGRGGIGKTSTALEVLHRLCKTERYQAIIWFSSRDIDLLPEGPKLVKPHVLTPKEIAKEFVRLLAPAESTEKGFDALTFMAQALTKSPLGSPFLFIFDNFETARNPVDVFNWIDTYIRNPNKVLITVRHGEFRGDYPIEVFGMNEEETDELITSTSIRLGIDPLITTAYRRELYQEANGHPYIIKVLLGEVAKNRKLDKVERIVAGKDDMLDALFERTYARLSPAAKRVFLTMCLWRSVIAKVALEAVLMRPANEKIDVEDSVDELVKSSFIETVRSDQDNMPFVLVPLTAAMFGRRKLDVSPMKPAIKADVSLLQSFGATQLPDIRYGFQPRIERLFRHIANEASQDANALTQHLPMLEFIARKYAPAWLMIASLHDEIVTPDAAEKMKEALRHYIEATPKGPAQYQAWDRLVRICQRTQDWGGEIHALLEMCQLPDASFRSISDSANRLNRLFHSNELVLDSDEKQIIVREIIQIMERRIAEADAFDCSRLAWLCLHSCDEGRAKKYTKYGLELDAENQHCLRLAKKLK